MFILVNVYNITNKHDKVWNSFVYNQEYTKKGEICYLPVQSVRNDYMIMNYNPYPVHGLTII